jgi:CheY-like chemotaxis protein
VDNQPAAQAPLRVAVLNTSEELIEMLCMAFEDHGYATVGAYIVHFKRGTQDLATFFATHQPDAVVYDIAVPYENNWRYFCDQVLTAGFLPPQKFVLTTTNKAALERLVGPTSAIELVGKPFDLEDIVAAVEQALQR